MLSEEDIQKIGWTGDFDWFRRVYPTMTFEELKRLYGIWYVKYPEQRYYNIIWFTECIRDAMLELGRNDLKIVEIGGYNGELALEMFRIFNKIEWLNIEVIGHNQLKELQNYNYKEQVLSKQIWDENPDISKYDFFITSDTIEHFPDNEVINIFEYISSSKIKYLSMKIQIIDNGQVWDGQAAAHLINMGTEKAKSILSDLNYELIRDDFGWISFWRLIK